MKFHQNFTEFAAPPPKSRPIPQFILQFILNLPSFSEAAVLQCALGRTCAPPFTAALRDVRPSLSATPWSLDERYDTVSFSDFSAKLSNFRGLVLFCIEADFCVQIRIFQHFSRSTRLAFLCTG